jgi:hypothetical protein
MPMNHTVVCVEPGTVLGGDVVLALVALEGEQGDLLLRSKGLDGVHEAIVQRANHGWRRNGIPEVLSQEGA